MEDASSSCHLQPWFCSYRNTIDTNVSIIEFDTIRPLFRFANLKKLCINIGAQVILDDGGLLEIAATWSHLPYFAL